MKRCFSLGIGAVSLICLGLWGIGMVLPSSAAAVNRVAIGTAGTTGVYYPYGGAVANILTKYASNMTAMAESTAGSVENIRLLNSGQIDIATVTADVTNQAFYDYKNSKYFKKKAHIVALFNMYTQPIHLVTLKNSGIKSVEDIRGKRVGVGAPGSGSEVKTRALLHILGLEYNRDFTPEFLSFGESADALKDGTIAAFFMSVATPGPALVNLALTNPCRLISLSDKEIAKVHKAYPFLSKGIIPAGTYHGIDKDVQTVAVQSLMVARSNLPDREAYEIVKTVFEHIKDLRKIHRAFNETALETATPTIIPVAPGAVKYYKEMHVYKAD